MKDFSEGRSMTIRIGLDDGQPPTGVVVGDDAVQVPFAGWLELMHAISRLASVHPLGVAVADADPIDFDELQEVIP
jgi:hypothetical protein